MENKKNIKLENDEILFLIGDTGTVGVVKLSEKQMIFLLQFRQTTLTVSCLIFRSNF